MATLPPGRADTDHLVDAADGVAHVAQAEGHAHHPEGIVRHRQALGVALHQDHATLGGPAFRTLASPRTSISRQKSVPTIGDRPRPARSYASARSAVPVQQSSTGTPGWGGTVRVVNRRQERSMFRLRDDSRSHTAGRSSANIRRTRWSDLSTGPVRDNVSSAVSGSARSSCWIRLFDMSCRNQMIRRPTLFKGRANRTLRFRLHCIVDPA